MSKFYARMQQRRGTAAEWTAANPILQAGEIGYETDTSNFKLGDGTTQWTDLEYWEGSLPDQTGNSGKFLSTDGTDAVWAEVDALPDQASFAGYFLTTDGSVASWAEVDALPSQTGNAGYYLKTDGTTASWDELSIDDLVTVNVSDLGDVTITGTPAEGEALLYDPVSEEWVNSAIEAGANVSTTTTAPSVEVENGDLWWNSEEGSLYVYFVDGDSDGYWVEATAGVISFQSLADLSDTNISTPADGEVLTYNGSQWTSEAIDIPAGTTISATAPSSPEAGQLWWDSTDGSLYVWYEDVDGSQWVGIRAASSSASIDVDDVEPGSPLTGNLWWNTDVESGKSLNVYNGSSWVNAQPLSGNAVINGDFGVWQRGTTFSGVGADDYTADRWLVRFPSGTTTITREAFTTGDIEAVGFGAAEYFIRNTTTGSTINDRSRLTHRVEDVTTFAGQQVTLSFWARGGTALNLQMRPRQYYGVGGSADTSPASQNVDITTSWARYSFTLQMPSIVGETVGTGSYFEFQFSQNSSLTDYSFDLWGVQLEAGSVATPFRPAGGGSKAAELALCQRYYEKSYNVDVVPGTSTTAGVHQEIGGSDNGGNATSAVSFAVTKRTAPTITLYSATGVQGNWLYFRSGVQGETSVSAPFVGETRMRVDVASVGAAWAVVGVRGHFVADAEL